MPAEQTASADRLRRPLSAGVRWKNGSAED